MLRTDRLDARAAPGQAVATGDERRDRPRARPVSEADDALAGLFGIDLDTGIDTGDAQSPAAKSPAKPRKQARRHAAPAPERQAPPVAKTRERSVSTVSAGRPRKATSGAARGKKVSPAAAPRKQAAAKAGDLPASKASTGRARKTASSAARGKTPSPTSKPRQRVAAKVRDAPATKAAASPRDIRPTGKWVARLRRRSGLSVARFAGQLGVSVVTVYRWEATPGPLNLHARPLNALMAFYRESGKF